ncbi:hypothetical protein QBZ16_000515 [Prototheca wickerhamii]|uniref:Uncharacterized protein n=1 Tax=Prototheca wickerhamii TaxID=3111 RepID=A0AAD9ILG7_PROWI|nr:hypothetical protein QBZ16_000515 [Prototheca wickerhamii]
MTYNKYAGLCADMLRAALKEPAKSKAKLSETVYFRSALWENGAPTKQVITDITEGAAGKLS